MKQHDAAPWRVENLPPLTRFNYSVYHCGLDRWDRVAIRNAGTSPLDEAFLEVSWSAYARPHLIRVPRLNPGQAFNVGSWIVPLLHCGRLRELDEREMVTWDVRRDGALLHRSQVHVLARNEWTWRRDCEASLAAFVQPGVRAVTEIFASSRSHLEKRSGCSTYQEAWEKGRQSQQSSPLSHVWTEMAAAIYDYIHDRCHWAYEYEPPSFEHDSQKLVCPEELWTSRQGTCIDLCVSYASCLERIHLRPIIVILRRGSIQHALAGWWLTENQAPDPVLRKKAVLKKLLKDDVQLVECTGFAQGRHGGKPLEKTSFERACKKANGTVDQWNLWAAVDVAAAREELAITPMPNPHESAGVWSMGLREFFQRHTWPLLPRLGGNAETGWLTDEVAAIFSQALRHAVAGGSGKLTTRHLLLALLSVEGGVAERTIQRLGKDPAWFRGKLTRQRLKETTGRPRPAVPSQAVTRTVKEAWEGDVQKRGIFVGESEIFRHAVSDKEGQTVRELLADLNCDRSRLIEAMEEVEKSDPVVTDPITGDYPMPET